MACLNRLGAVAAYASSSRTFSSSYLSLLYFLKCRPFVVGPVYRSKSSFQNADPEIGSRECRARRIRRTRRRCSAAPADEDAVFLTDLQVPEAWVSPDAAAQEAEWLRVALHQWLDDEYCPEPANEEISRRCAKVFYYCLLEKQLDVGDILMQMARDLETFCFKESFHGAFSSANAAIDLITRRMRTQEGNSS